MISVSSLLSRLRSGPIVKQYRLEVLAQERHLGEIRDFVARIAEETRLNVSDTNNIKLALDEACSNVVRHAYKGRDDGRIRLEVAWRQRALEIEILDQGKSFDWRHVRTPDLNRYVEIGKKGGLGIWFIRKLMDRADYRVTPQGNRLSLSKRLEGGGKTRIAPTPAVEPAKPASGIRGIRFSTKFVLPVTFLVAVLLTAAFLYMGMEQARSLRSQILDSFAETGLQLAKDSVNYLVKKDDLHLAGMVKAQVRSNPKLAYAFVLDNQRWILAHSTTRKMFTDFVPPKGYRWPLEKNTVRQLLDDPGLGPVLEWVTPIFLGDQRLGTAHVGMLQGAVDAEIRSGWRTAILIYLVALVVSVVGTYLLMTFLFVPMRKLTDGMLAISEGRLDHHLVIRSNDEFGQIANIFNDMTRRFKDAQKNLLEQERFQKEMQVAQEIQHTLLPREIPQIEGFELASIYRSAKEVGGDYFDFVWVDDHNLGMAVADVSGKGIPGSLVMTMIRTALRLEARGNKSATDVLAKVNRFVTRDMKKGMFVTMFYIVVDSRKRVIRYASAGHNPMILYREENDQIYYLKPHGFPLGIDLPDPDLFDRSLTQDQVKLKQGDLLMVYTDGITEAMNSRREQFGEKRLLDLIRGHHTQSATEFVETLSREIAEFTGDYPQNDDITCVVVKEKLQADDLEFNTRRKLFYLVEVQGVSVAEACRHLKLSPSTYYRLKRLREGKGLEALRNSPSGPAAEMQHLSLDEQQAVIKVVREFPAYGAAKIAACLAERAGGKEGFSVRQVARELKRLRLTTREARRAFAAKKSVDSV